MSKELTDFKRQVEYKKVYDELNEHLSQSEVANQLGVGRTCISNRVNGKQVVTVESLRAIKELREEIKNNLLGELS